jgi:hypothetical protein
MTRPSVSAWGLLLLLIAGCSQPKPRPELNFSYYNSPEFHWRHVGRVLLLPVVNESATPEATEQMRAALNAELQQLGLFEVVSTPPDAAARLARSVRDGGRFDEAEVIALARCANADAVVAITLSHYSPYYRPRIGLSAQAISPDLGKVVSSVDGLWDSNNLAVADRARRYYAGQKLHSVPGGPHRGVPDDPYGYDLVLQSPHLFQRFVAAEAARVLVADAAFLNAVCPKVVKQPCDVKPPGPPPAPPQGPPAGGAQGASPLNASRTQNAPPSPAAK